LFIYRYAFTASPRIGYASAAGIFFGLIAMVFSLIQGFFIQRGGRVRIGGGNL
jgi:ABC-type sugar transport system permease subunit